MKVGIGYDIHKLVEGKALFLGGIEIPHPQGLEGHSDGDVLLHAVSDAILGALGKEDIGTRFPDTDPANKGMASSGILREAKRVLDEEGYKLANLDCVVMAEAPRISRHREAIRSKISGILEVSPDAVNVKGKTGEKLGVIGQSGAIAVHAVVLLEKIKGD